MQFNTLYAKIGPTLKQNVIMLDGLPLHAVQEIKLDAGWGRVTRITITLVGEAEIDIDLTPPAQPEADE